MAGMLVQIIALVFVAVIGNPHVICQTSHQILKSGSIIHFKFFDKCLQLFDNTDEEIRFRLLTAGSDRDLQILVLNDKQNKFVSQQPTGHPYSADEFVVISAVVNGSDAERQAYQIEYYRKDSSQAFAVSHISPVEKSATDGQVVSPVIDTNTNAIIGTIDVKYLVIRPIAQFNAEAGRMLSIKPGAIMGHRGTGSGRRTDLSGSLGVLENTIEAFNYACDHGADMVELDIQISKDKIPIIHHDFDSKALLREKTGNNFETLAVPVKDITYSVMQKISSAENKDFDYAANQPFETLKDVLTQVRPNCAINFEIKYPQKYSDGTWNGVKGLELNEYIDLIVKTLYEHIGNRSGIITSFEPDLCAMIHYKQNLLPVAFLTSGDVRHWNPNAKVFADPRTRTVPLNTYFAEGFGLNGLSIQATDLVNNRSLIAFVKSHKQPVYIWGDSLNNLKLLQSLLKDGADGLIINNVDKIVGHPSDTEDTEGGSSANNLHNYLSIIFLPIMSTIANLII